MVDEAGGAVVNKWGSRDRSIARLLQMHCSREFAEQMTDLQQLMMAVGLPQGPDFANQCMQRLRENDPERRLFSLYDLTVEELGKIKTVLLKKINLDDVGEVLAEIKAQASVLGVVVDSGFLERANEIQLYIFQEALEQIKRVKA